MVSTQDRVQAHLASGHALRSSGLLAARDPHGRRRPQGRPSPTGGGPSPLSRHWQLVQRGRAKLCYGLGVRVRRVRGGAPALWRAAASRARLCTCLATPVTATAVSASVSAAATAASHRAATLDAACHLPRLCVKLYVVIGYTPTYREESCHSAQAHSCYVRRRVELEDERSHSQSHAMGMAITKLCKRK